MSRGRRSGASAPHVETGPPASCAAAGAGGLVAQIVRRHWPDYVALMRERGLEVPPEQMAAAQDIRDCRTAALGAQMLACPSCGHRHVVYHSCHHRLCPQCGGRQASAWLSRQRARQLRTPYFLVTFTVPKPLRAVVRRHPRLCMELMFAHSAGALQDAAGARKHLDGELGLISVLHTWRRDLGFHPHIHVLLPGAGLDAQKDRCTLPKKDDYLAPVARLSACWRARMEEALRVHLPQEHARFASALWRKGWVTHVQPAGTGTEALMYLARYLNRSALGPRQLLGFDARGVTFRWQDRQSGQPRTATVPPGVFLHRLFQHTLPKGFRRVRAYGWLAPAAKKRFALVQSLAGRAADRLAPPAAPDAPSCSTENPNPLRQCRRCGSPVQTILQQPRRPRRLRAPLPATPLPLRPGPPPPPAIPPLTTTAPNTDARPPPCCAFGFAP